MAVENRRPLIASIKRHSLEDGPGVRTAVFFKGCPLRCTFCQNPETQEAGPEIAFQAGSCVQCKNCLNACALGAIDFDLAGRVNRSLCDRCGLCAAACPSGALRQIGAYYPVEELAELLLRDAAFYRHSGGGVTLSGGECTLYPVYLKSLLAILRTSGVRVALQTAGYFDYEIFRRDILPFIERVYFDVKLADPVLHEQYTGASNARILSNLARLLSEPNVIVCPRVPLIPGITASEQNLRRIAGILAGLGAREVSLLPYNPAGFEKWTMLGKEPADLPRTFMEAAAEAQLAEQFNASLREASQSTVLP